MQHGSVTHWGDRDAASLNLPDVAPVPLGVREPHSPAPAIKAGAAVNPPPEATSDSNDGAVPVVRDVLPGIVDASPMPIALFQRDKSVVYRNAAWTSLFGPDDTQVGAGDSDPIAGALERRTGHATAERSVLRPDGSTVRVLVTATPIIDPRNAVIGVAAYGEALDRAAASTLREAFIGVLSHELRTPITSIYGGSQLLLNEDLSPDSRSEVLATIAAEAEHLHRRVEDFLAVVRVERGASQPEREPISMARAIRQAVAAEIRRSGDRRYAVSVEPDLPPATGDEAQIGQILRNLIANAVTVTPRGGAIAIEATRSGHSVETRIKDRGVVPVEAGDDAFSLSYRHGAVGGHTPSSGLGLYVARVLVEVNGGRIGIRTRRGGGTEVSFTLPLHDIPTDA